MLSLLIFALWDSGHAVAAIPGLGHVRTWGLRKVSGLCKPPGEISQLLHGLLSTPQAVDCCSSGFFSFYAHLAHLWNRAGALCGT